MSKTLRARLILGLTPTLLILVGLGLWAVQLFYQLGGNIDVILRENYRSVLAAESMKEALERMNSALLFAMTGREERANDLYATSTVEFLNALSIELHTITLAGEGELADNIKSEFDRYTEFGREFLNVRTPPDARSVVYFSKLLPLFETIKELADRILTINQENMESMDRQARANAARSTRLMIFALFAAVVLSVFSIRRLAQRILEPIQAVTSGARALAQGDLDQVVPASSPDELGELGSAFNTMARTIREYREAGTSKLLRARKTAQATIDSFPDPIVLVDTLGSAERANPAAERLLEVTVADDLNVPWNAPPLIQPHLKSVLSGRGNYTPSSLDLAISLRDGDQERYFLPRILGIQGDRGELLGAAVVLSDVTKFHLVDRIKSDMIATVSHELKTPLTSVQMVIHLLLEEAVGPLDQKQVELLLTARQDSDRLLGMINDLLDLAQIEQGKDALKARTADPSQLVREAMDRFQTVGEELGVRIQSELPAQLPAVQADRERIAHVFDNLVSNAIRHTGRGGIVKLTAEQIDHLVRFTVEDTGEGVSDEALPHLFEKFYRAPGSKHHGGVGLGLAIVKEIVEAHGGRVDVQSREGEGATFRFTLPTA